MFSTFYVILYDSSTTGDSKTLLMFLNKIICSSSCCNLSKSIPYVDHTVCISVRQNGTEKLNPYSANVENMVSSYQCWGPRWRSWLRHCATSQKVAGSIPDGVIGIFH